jgi:hypothetical protein
MNQTLQDPMTKRNDVSVKLDADVATEAMLVAKSRGIPQAEYLSHLLRPLVHADLEREMTRRLGAGKPKGGK